MGMMGVRFEGEDAELRWITLRLEELWDMVSGVHRALVHWAPTTFQASAALKSEDKETEAQRN